MQFPLKTLEANTKGRDFVIGDLHGAYSVLQNLLTNIKFNTEIDRLISVGDLVDRGPDSLKCLSLLKEPWFHSVLSNHEQMMLEKFYTPGGMGFYWFQNGGGWGAEAFNDYLMMKNSGVSLPEKSAALVDLLPLVKELPYLITVNTKSNKKYHVLHAEMPSEHITDEDLTTPERVLELATVFRDEGDVFLWGRHLFRSFYDRDLSNRAKIISTISFIKNTFHNELSHIISGHTLLQQPMTIYGQTCIDTGASFCYGKVVRWEALTCIELDSWTFYQATVDTFKKVKPFVVTEKDIKRKMT